MEKFQHYITENTLIIECPEYINLLNFNLSFEQQKQVIVYSLYDTLMFIKPHYLQHIINIHDKRLICNTCLTLIEQNKLSNNAWLDMTIILHFLVQSFLI